MAPLDSVSSLEFRTRLNPSEFGLSTMARKIPAKIGPTYFSALAGLCITQNGAGSPDFFRELNTEYNNTAQLYRGNFRANAATVLDILPRKIFRNVFPVFWNNAPDLRTAASRIGIGVNEGLRRTLSTDYAEYDHPRGVLPEGNLATLMSMGSVTASFLAGLTVSESDDIGVIVKLLKNPDRWAVLDDIDIGLGWRAIQNLIAAEGIDPAVDPFGLSLANKPPFVQALSFYSLLWALADSNAQGAFPDQITAEMALNGISRNRNSFDGRSIEPKAPNVRGSALKNLFSQDESLVARYIAGAALDPDSDLYAMAVSPFETEILPALFNLQVPDGSGGSLSLWPGSPNAAQVSQDASSHAFHTLMWYVAKKTNPFQADGDEFDRLSAIGGTYKPTYSAFRKWIAARSYFETELISLASGIKDFNGISVKGLVSLLQ